jgi:hypothetical protein
MKIRPVGTDVFHGTDGQTGMTTQIVAFSNFANAPTNKAQALIKYASLILFLVLRLTNGTLALCNGRFLNLYIKVCVFSHTL